MSAVPSAFDSLFLLVHTPACRFPMFSPTRRNRGNSRRLPPPTGLRFAAQSHAIAVFPHRLRPGGCASKLDLSRLHASVFFRELFRIPQPAENLLPSVLPI